ncbi:hypothetical protein B0H10DRAFT_2225547 [Mycena sp. CBHHK59/15]|nr:hypothetical protein B0H10DRAFT_2225547 [Mycena sp. CBHHK59/15]
MNRIRKAFQKDNSDKLSDTSAGSKPVYRGTKPLTVSDIHSVMNISPPVRKGRYWYAEGYSEDEDDDDNDANIEKDVVDSFPLPPASINPRSHRSPSGYSRSHRSPSGHPPADELLPSPPQQVLDLVEHRQRERTRSSRSHQARLEQPSSVPLNVHMSSYHQPAHRRPLYATSHSNMLTRSLGANASFKAGPIAQRPAVQQAFVPMQPLVAQTVYAVPPVPHHPSSPMHPSSTHETYSAPPAGRPRLLYTMPEGEHKRLRSTPAQVSATHGECHRFYASTVQGRPGRRI